MIGGIIKKTVLMTDEFGEDTISQFTDVEKVKRDGLKVEVKKENGNTQITICK